MCRWPMAISRPQAIIGSMSSSRRPCEPDGDNGKDNCQEAADETLAGWLVQDRAQRAGEYHDGAVNCRCDQEVNGCEHQGLAERG